MNMESVDFVVVSSADVEDLRETWGEKAYRHFHLDDGFMIQAIAEGKSIGLISSYWRELPHPLQETRELYIDFLAVDHAYRRQGIAKALVERTMDRAMLGNAYQVRSWSSDDKLEAIPMWKRLGFGLCPATTYPGSKEVNGFFVVKRLA
jgi:ribosomal protein S18 acetylase RimI-like enzyme